MKQNIKTKSKIKHKKFVKPRSPYPYFGGKHKIASVVWDFFGDDCTNYIEPFFGGGAVLLARPTPFKGVETINDSNGFIVNFWRAIKADPKGVAAIANYPITEIDHKSRNKKLYDMRLPFWKRLEDDPDYYDIKIAGWWIWGISASIDFTYGITKTVRLSLVTKGAGVHGVGLQDYDGKKIESKLQSLARRLRFTRVQCGDWSRNVAPRCLQDNFHPTAVFLDPPYEGYESLYHVKKQEISVTQQCIDWAAEHGNDPNYRIIICGFNLQLEKEGWRKYNYELPKTMHGEDNTSYKDEMFLISPYCKEI